MRSWGRGESDPDLVRAGRFEAAPVGGYAAPVGARSRFVVMACAAAVWGPSCGRIGYGGRDGPGVDSGVGDAGPTGDAGRDGSGADGGPGPCHAAWLAGTVTLRTPQRLDMLASADEERDPVLSPDGLSLFFARGPGSDRDIYEAVRPSLDAPFEPATLRADLSSPEDETKVTFSGDGLVAILASDRMGGPGRNDLWYGTRVTDAEPFGTFTLGPLVDVNTDGIDLDPHLSADGLRLYHAPRRVTAVQALFVSERSDRTSAFGTPQELAEINVRDTTADPSLTADERIIYYSALDTGDDRDLYHAVRDAPGEPFEPGRRIPVGTPDADEGDPVVSADGCELFYASDTAGEWDLYLAEVAPGG